MAKNIFIGILMPLLVFSILSYTWYQFLFNVLDLHYNSIEQRWITSRGSVFTAAVTSLLCLLSALSYCDVMLTRSKPIPLYNDENRADMDEANEFPQLYFSPNLDPDVVALSLSGEKGHPLYCEKCQSNKPERAHHCKQCNRCAPKMDHHCVWINGCADENNYKAFFLFVLYVPLYCLFAEFTMLPLLWNAIIKEVGTITLIFCWKVYKVYIGSIYHFWKNLVYMVWSKSWIPFLSGVPSLGLESISFHWFVLAVLGVLFGLTLTGFAGVHLWYILRNQSSIEFIATRPVYVRADFDKSGNNYEVIKVADAKKMYDLGPLKNWCSVMGSNPLLWFVPFTGGNSNSHKAVNPYNLKFCDKIIRLVASFQFQNTF